MYTLLIGKKSEHRKYRTIQGLRRRLALQAETTSKGGKEFATLRVDTWQGTQFVALTFHKSEDGNEWGWGADPGIPQVHGAGSWMSKR